MTITKILKELRRSAPHIRWIRQSKFDVAESDAQEAHWTFAGAIGKEGIRFAVPHNVTLDELHVRAKIIANRLLRGDDNA